VKGCWAPRLRAWILRWQFRRGQQRGRDATSSFGHPTVAHYTPKSRYVEEWIGSHTKIGRISRGQCSVRVERRPAFRRSTCNTAKTNSPLGSLHAGRLEGEHCSPGSVSACDRNRWQVGHFCLLLVGLHLVNPARRPTNPRVFGVPRVQFAAHRFSPRRCQRSPDECLVLRAALEQGGLMCRCRLRSLVPVRYTLDTRELPATFGRPLY